MISLDEAIAQRHSVRNFTKKQVERTKIRAILNAGRLAPSAKNRQPWRFVLLADEMVKTIALSMEEHAVHFPERGSTVKASAAILRRAPAVIAVLTSEETESAFLSLGACLENMSLKAVDLGLGSLIICDFQCVRKEIVPLFPDGHALAALFAVGYEDGVRPRAAKRPLSEVAEGFFEEEERAVDPFPEASVEKEPFVFISYSHRDADIVIADIVELKRHGVRLWYDRSILCGEAWDKKALGIIGRENCAGVLVYVSESSAASESVCEELTCARKKFPEEGKILGIHIGDLPIGRYLGTSPACDRAFRSVFSEKSKYIPRSRIPGSLDAAEEIVAECVRLGAVSESGVYDEFKYRKVSDGMEISQYIGSSARVTIPTSIGGTPVTAIGKSAMRGNPCIREIVVPATVKRIDEGAFFGLEALRDILLPDSVEYLGVAAFRGCTALTHVRLPSKLKRLEEALFRECSALEECDVPYGVESFGEAVFNGCTNLRRVYVPPTVRRMTEGGFFGCTSLCDLTLPKDIAGLEKQSFETCPNVNIDAGGFSFRGGKAVKLPI